MAGFMAGFGTTLSNSIEQDREYYREAASKRRDYLQTYGTRAVVDREDKANAAMGTLNALRTAGVDDNTLRYVLDKGGIQGIAQLSARIGSRDDLTKDDIAGIVEGAKDYVSDNPDESFNAVVNRAYGLYKSTDKPVERKRNIFAAVLGLDARMAEDEVLDDLYVNGYSGRDMYRIMGSSGPKAGEALSFNLPAKPPSVQEIRMTNEVLADKFNTSIDSKIKTLTQAQSRKSNTAAENEAIIDQRTNFESIKGRGVLGYAEYANIDTTFWDYAKSLEDMTPGVVTRNPTMMDFGSAFKTYWGDMTDDANMNNDNTGGKDTKKPNVSSPLVPTPTGSVTDFDNNAAFNEAAARGDIKPGDQVRIGDGPVMVLPAPAGEDEVLKGVGINPITATGSEAVKPEDTKVLSTEANFDRDGDLSGYTDLYESIMARPEGERSDFLKTATALSEQKNLADITVALAEATPEFTDRAVGATAGGVVVAANWLNKGIAYAYNRLTGDSNTAAGMLITSDLNIEKGKEIIAEGIVATLQEQADRMKLGGAFGPGRADKIKKSLADKRALREELTESDVLNKAAEDMLLRIQDNDRQFLADERDFPYVKPSEVTGTAPTYVDRPSKTSSLAGSDDKEATLRRIQDNDRQFLADERDFPYVKPSEVTGPAPTYVDRPSETPSKTASFLSLIASLAGANDEDKTEILDKFRTRNEPRGLMSSPRPKMKPPRLGQPGFMDLIKTLHGPSSSITTTWEEKTSSSDAKIRVYDVRRLIKDTKALPDTKSRGTLLQSLYELRDVLNKRK